MKVYKVCHLRDDGTMWSAIVKERQGGRQYKVGVTLRSRIAPFMAFVDREHAKDFIYTCHVSVAVVLECEAKKTFQPWRVMWSDILTKNRIHDFWKALLKFGEPTDWPYDVNVGHDRRFSTTVAPRGTILCMDITPLQVLGQDWLD